MTKTDLVRAVKRRAGRYADAEPSTLLSDQPTIELIIKARRGDPLALEALLQRCLPQLKRWAHGRLPAAARGHIDTADLVQDAAIHALARLETFEPRHVGAMQAYLRQSVINRIRDEMRRVARRPPPAELPETLSSTDASPLEFTIQGEAYERYRAALVRLRSKDREIIVARIEAQWTIAEISRGFGFATEAAARMAVNRALKRLIALIGNEKPIASRGSRPLSR
jgi:RNA polymerase sigma-70 factor (ECF subfamily)